IDYYDDIFTPVARMETIRLLILQAAQNGWKIYQMDVKSAFLNGVLDEVVYIEQSPGYMKVVEETEAYAKEILKRIKMEDCNPVVTPMKLGSKLSEFEGGEPGDAEKYRSLVGSLRYITSTRPDLSYSAGVISRFMENLKYAHWKALKRILRYVKGTESLGLFYSSSKEYTLTGYSDSDWHGDVDDRKSTSGYVFFMGKTAFTWALKKQPIVALSTCPTEIKVDNKSAIELPRNPVHHERSKHIDVRFHFIREHIRNRDVQLTHVMSRDQAADIFTKSLPAELFNLCKQKMGMKDASDVGRHATKHKTCNLIMNIINLVPDLQFLIGDTKNRSRGYRLFNIIEFLFNLKVHP
nr:retrovirus-related Pol polyprotein from transposon TNT 1-94 [Tanacetum cinerariifolium]